ncbi:MAG: hypothetical protein P8Z33_13490, partial [Gammaproteobacteria bacterium]
QAASATAHTDIGDVLEMLPSGYAGLLHLILSEVPRRGEWFARCPRSATLPFQARLVSVQKR